MNYLLSLNNVPICSTDVFVNPNSGLNAFVFHLRFELSGLKIQTIK